MNRFYDTIGELKVYEICDFYRLSYKERGELRDVFIRLDAIEQFLEEEDERLIRSAKTDVIESALQGNSRGLALWHAITSICDEFRRIRDAVYQLKDLPQEGVLLH